MLDRPVRKLIDPWLDATAARLAAAGISATTLTVGGFGLGMAACVAIALGYPLIGLAFILANRLADGLDGSVARRTRVTDVGGFLDIVLDVIFYSGVPFAFAVADPDVLLPAAFLIYSFVATAGSFLAYAVIAEKRGVTADAVGRKSFVYSVGLMEGTETIAFFVLFCVIPDRFALLAWIFGGLCWLTALLRVISGVIAFRDGHSPSPDGKLLPQSTTKVAP